MEEKEATIEVEARTSNRPKKNGPAKNRPNKQERKNQNTAAAVIGIVLIAVGALWLVSNVIPGFEVNWELAWPAFILVPGMILWGVYIGAADKQRAWGVTIPATILTCLSMLFFVNMYSSIYLNYPELWGWTSFAYTGIVAFALMIAYEFTGRKKEGLLKASRVLWVITLVIMGSVSISMTFSEVPEVATYLGPAVIILVGLLIIAGQFRKRK